MSFLLFNFSNLDYNLDLMLFLISTFAEHVSVDTSHSRLFTSEMKLINIIRSLFSNVFTIKLRGLGQTAQMFGLFAHSPCFFGKQGLFKVGVLG